MGAVTNAATGEILGLDGFGERDSDGFMEWLGDFARGFRDEAMVTDDLSAYKRAGASGNPASDLHSPREEAGVKPSRQDRGMGAGQGEDMAAAEGICPLTATWSFHVWSALFGTATSAR